MDATLQGGTEVMENRGASCTGPSLDPAWSDPLLIAERLLLGANEAQHMSLAGDDRGQAPWDEGQRGSLCHLSPPCRAQCEAAAGRARRVRSTFCIPNESRAHAASSTAASKRMNTCPRVKGQPLFKRPMFQVAERL